MKVALRCRVSSAWSGWIDADGRRRSLDDASTGSITPEAFAGRWNPIRDLPEEIEPLPAVVGNALARAGSWEPGSGATCAGGLVVGADTGFLPPSMEFTRELAVGYSARVSPGSFIHSLPSTAASVLTKLYGFADYQATVVQGALSGVRALAHALDLMAAGRLDRALVAALSVATVPDGGSLARIAVALWLEPETEPRGVLVGITIGGAGTTSAPANADRYDVPRRLHRFGPLAAWPLVHFSTLLDGADCHTPREILLSDERDPRVSIGIRLV